MSITSQIERLQNNALATKEAIVEKGGVAPLNSDGFALAILDLPSGGVLEPESKDVDFYDYDGTLLYSYSCEEALALEALPPLPDRTAENLTCLEWNYTLEDIKQEVTAQGQCVVGATYVTTDGKTYIEIELDENCLDVVMQIAQSKANGIKITWGDGDSSISGTSGVLADMSTLYNTVGAALSHIYSEAGTYTITIEPTDDSVEYGWAGWYEGSYLIRRNVASPTTTENQALTYRIKSLKLGKNIPAIAYLTFFGLGNILYINLPNSIVRANGLGFTYCYLLRAIVLPKSLQRILTHTIVHTVGGLKCVSVPRSITTATSLLLGNNSSIYLTKWVIPFNYPYSVMPVSNTLRKVKIFKCVPNATTLAAALSSWVNLEEAELADTLTALPSSCFSGCYKLKFLALPSLITAIPASAFSGCVSMTNLEINSDITSIAASAFADCCSLNRLEFLYNTAVPTLSNTNAFSGMLSVTAQNTRPSIVVPKNLYNTWQNSTNWTTYKRYICWKDLYGEHYSNPDWTFTEGKVIPDQLQECEYITPNGTNAYLTAWIRAYETDEVITECKFYCTAKLSSRQLIGTDTARYFGITASGKVENCGTATTLVGTGSWLNIKLHVYTLEDGSSISDLYNNGELLHSKTVTLSHAFFAIFTIGSKTSTASTSYLCKNWQIASYKITINGVLRGNYIPCYIKATGEVGMFDTVLLEFLVNANTAGAFTAGPDKT